jgi:hypothetical protein
VEGLSCHAPRRNTNKVAKVRWRADKLPLQHNDTIQHRIKTVQIDLSDLSSLRNQVSRDWLHAVATGNEAERRDNEQALRCIDYLLSLPSESGKAPQPVAKLCAVCQGTGFDGEGQPCRACDGSSGRERKIA